MDITRRNEMVADAVRKKRSAHVGSGSFGDVYRPPIGSRDRTQVGKLFKKNGQFRQEYEDGMVMREVNADQHFLVTPEIMTPENRDLLQLRYGYAGVPMTVQISESMQQELEDGTLAQNASMYIRHTVLQMYLFLQKYMNTLGHSEYVHLDIKDSNVMYHYEPSRHDECHLRLIDFSLARRVDDVFDPAKNPPQRRGYNKMYSIWPPEYNLYNLAHPSLASVPIQTRIETVSRITPTLYRYKTGLIRNHMTLDALEERRVVAFVPTRAQAPVVARAIDAWSIGVMFLKYIDTLCVFVGVDDMTTTAVEAVVQCLLVPAEQRSLSACMTRLKNVLE